MNSLNLRQVCGGDTIKQADFGSELAFELLDEQYVKFREPLGEAAKVILKKDNTAIYQKSVPITQNTVLFKFDKILPVGSYVLEIIVGDYVFPSNNRVIITVEQTYGDFEPEYLVKVSYEELKADVDDLKSKVTALEERPIVDTVLTERVEALEQKEDKDTLYDDTAIKKELGELNQSISKKKLYYAYANDENGTKGFTKADVYDWFYRELYPYFGISDKDSDNPNDYIWMPARLASNDKLDGAIIEINKLKKLHEARRPPTSYTLDRTTTPWTVWFDNGCGLQFPSYSPRNDEDSDGENTIYGFGYSTNISNTVPYQFPLPQSIIAASMGHISLLKFGKHDVNSFIYWDTNTKVLNPIRDDADKYDWSRCYGENGNDVAWKATRKTVFPRVCYELGIWSEADVLYLGATKK
ncbi:hypothetical protein [Enterococcus cecorum]|uniref:hypothetical protein n=1 Tax=Enterococcus cecorum TaxID=44008 RepID=UPI000A69BDF9|nr:hypothetical protein [Enterococcus cecorum]CAI3346320.1 hypothetical protein CIRMBP1309_00391 [Enterococcus cecorum]